MFKKILAPIDMQHSHLAGRLLKQVDEMAEAFGAQVHVITVIPGYGMPIVAAYFPATAQQKVKKEMAEELEKFVRSKMKNKATTSVSVGKRAESILKVARQRKPDLMIIGYNKRGTGGEMLLGSCSAKLATHSPCSVMALKLSRDGER